jgi:DNA-binding CsgD family transcriptional regulator
MVRDLRQLEGVLITDIYAALLGHGDWQTFVDRVTEILPNGKATMFYHDYTARSGALSINSRIDADSIAAYSQYYAAKNPWMPKALTRPLGLGLRAEQMLPRKELFRTEFYTDYLQPQGVCSAAGVTIFRDRGCNFMLSVLSGPAEDEEAEAAANLLTRLAPHLRQAFTYYRSGLAGVSPTPTMANAATEALGVAFLAVGLGRQILSANAVARELLSSGEVLHQDTKGRLTARSPDLLDALDRALDAAARGEAHDKRTFALKSREKAGTPFRVTLVVPELQPFERFFAGPCVLLLVQRQEQRRLPTEEALRLSFGLTRTEAALAVTIARGNSLKEAADQLRISRETARTHLKSIFAKMDIHRQAELVGKVYELGEA